MGKEEIIRVYKELMHMRWKRLAICLLILALCILFFTVAIGTAWITDDVFLFAIICVFSAILAFSWEVQTILKYFKPLQNILFQECDAAKLLEITKQGVAYGLEDAKNQKSAAFLQFEGLYTSALIIMGETEEALKYLNEAWRSPKRKAYKQLMWQVQLNIVAEKKEKDTYFTLFEQAPATVKKSPVFQTQKAIVEEKYDEAIRIMQDKFKVNNPLQKIQEHYFLGKCYHELGEYETAGIYFAYVTANGKDLVYKKKVLELTAENK